MYIIPCPICSTPTLKRGAAKTCRKPECIAEYKRRKNVEYQHAFRAKARAQAKNPGACACCDGYVDRRVLLEHHELGPIDLCPYCRGAIRRILAAPARELKLLKFYEKLTGVSLLG